MIWLILCAMFVWGIYVCIYGNVTDDFLAFMAGVIVIIFSLFYGFIYYNQIQPRLDLAECLIKYNEMRTCQVYFDYFKEID